MAKVETGAPEAANPPKRISGVFRLSPGVELGYDEIISDYRIAYQSRQASLIGRKEVHGGKTTFGIFGDGKEVAQLAMAKAFKPGDIRSGYYRDQTFMLAAGMSNVREFFAQLYADSDLSHDPASGGRQMTSHFATRMLDEEGNFLRIVEGKHTTSDISPTGGQMARLLGLAYASKLYRNEPTLRDVRDGFSVNGNEVAFGTIGNASTSEGIFFETINAAGVLQVPMIVSVWDDGYGISVPNELQTTKSSISEVLKGFQYDESKRSGLDIYAVKGWDYPALCRAYLEAVDRVRREHIPAVLHIIEMTQPQGHSTSGSHERYKSKVRLEWEEDNDPLLRMRTWMIAEGVANAGTLDGFEVEDRSFVEQERKAAWDAYMGPLRTEQAQATELIEKLTSATSVPGLDSILSNLKEPLRLHRRLIQSSAVRALRAVRDKEPAVKTELSAFLSEYRANNDRRYNSHLHSESKQSPLEVEVQPPVYSQSSEIVDGRVVLQRCFDANLSRDPRIFSLGEDVGKMGDVNLVFQGLNSKYGDLRVTDTGIREASILGQGIGAAMRGLRPIVDIQYLDYFLYAIQVCSDDLATLHYRTAGGQKSPVVIRTKGHRFDGIWHTGSPMAMILHSCRGLYLAVPRDMTRAAGMYNTLLRSDNPAIVIEVLSGYRDKEKVPDNVGTFTIPLGVPEVLRAGSDLTLVTYGECCQLALEASSTLAELGVDVELIDIQTLSPFDIDHAIAGSLTKTNALLVVDEDVPGGASAFILQQVLEEQGGWELLDSAPHTLTAKPNRSPYGTDGGYFSKPNVEDIVGAAYSIMSDRNPAGFPPLS